MSLGSFYRGTTVEQDGRFRNKEKKLMGNINFPKEFDVLIEPTKIDMKSIKQWIEKKMKSILGFDDEFCVNYTISLIEEKIDPKKIYLQLIGFLNNQTSNFMSQLWKLLITAQDSPLGIPPEILQEKSAEEKKKSERQLENIKCLEKILAKEDEKKKDKKLSKKNYKNDDSIDSEESKDSNSNGKNIRKRKYSRSRSRNKSSDDDYKHKHAKEKKSRHKNRKRSRSKSESRSRDRKHKREYKKKRKAEYSKEERSSKNKKAYKKDSSSSSEDDNKKEIYKEKIPKKQDDLEQTKKEILNMQIEKKK